MYVSFLNDVWQCVLQVESLELEIEEQRIRLQRVLAESELKERHLHEEFSERVIDWC